MSEITKITAINLDITKADKEITNADTEISNAKNQMEEFVEECGGLVKVSENSAKLQIYEGLKSSVDQLRSIKNSLINEKTALILERDKIRKLYQQGNDK